FEIEQIAIGQRRRDPSYALLDVRADTPERLRQILETIGDHGAVPVEDSDCRLVEADIAGAFTEGFYSTTNQRTQVRLAGEWIEVDLQEMDCGVAVDPQARRAWCVPMSEVEPGQQYVV